MNNTLIIKPDQLQAILADLQTVVDDLQAITSNPAAKVDFKLRIVMTLLATALMTFRAYTSTGAK